jgi:hypothetical protein
MGNRKRICSFLPLSDYDDISGVCGCASYWESTPKRKDMRTAGMSCSSHDSFLGAPAMPLSVFSIQDGEIERVINPLSPPRVVGNEDSAALRVYPQAHVLSQYQRSQLLESRTAELPLRAAVTATAADDENDAYDADEASFRAGHITAAGALRIVRHMAKRGDPDCLRITGDNLQEVLAYHATALEEREDRTRMKRRAKRRLTRSMRVRTSQELEDAELLQTAHGGSRVLVDYELPAGEERLEWDTDLVRRTFGEIE